MINIVLKIKTAFVSVNSLYAPKLTYQAGRPKVVMYKNPKAIQVENTIREQLRAIDFKPYLEFLKTTKRIKFLIQFIFKRDVVRKDVSNYVKNLEDIWVRFVREDLGLDEYDDRLHLEIHAYKATIPEAKEDIACVSISESFQDLRFDRVPSPTKIWSDGEVGKLKGRGKKLVENKTDADTFIYVVDSENPMTITRYKEILLDLYTGRDNLYLFLLQKPGTIENEYLKELEKEERLKIIKGDKFESTET